MEYLLTVTKRERNPKYSEQFAPHYYSHRVEPEYIIDKCAEQVLSEEEFKAIKRALSEVL